MFDATTAPFALQIEWQRSCALVNLRIEAVDEPLLEAMLTQAHVAVPTQSNTTLVHGSTRCVWAGPDDWFVMDTGCPALKTADLQQRLQTPLNGRHNAVTDVSSGYRVLSLRGVAAREVLAQGCPLDLHPRSFQTGTSAGTHYFKASVWLWQVEDEPSFQMLVRRSFAPYVHLMLQKTTREHASLADYDSEEV